MSIKPAKIFIVWTSLLSVTFAALLLPNIVDKYGILLSLFYTSLGVSVIWLVYFGIGKFIEWAVDEEIKQKSHNHAKSNNNQLVK